MRYRVHLTLTGNRIRLRFSNELGRAAVVIGGVSVGRAEQGSNIQPGTIVQVTFGGNPAVIIPSGEPILSDPIDPPVYKSRDLMVSVYLAEGANLNHAAGVPSFFVANVNAVNEDTISAAKPIDARSILSGVEVITDACQSSRIFVVLDDSITDNHVSISPQARVERSVGPEARTWKSADYRRECRNRWQPNSD